MIAFPRSLWFKITAAFLLVIVISVAVVSVLTNQVTAVSFRRFLDAETSESWGTLQADLANYYAQQGSWGGVETVLQTVALPRGQGNIRLQLLDGQGNVVAGTGNQRGQASNSTNLPIEVAGRQVGTLLVVTPGQGSSRAGEQFLAEVNRAIIWGAITAVFLALLLGGWVAHRLTQPLRQLTQATHQLATGHLDQQVTVATQDELGDLAASFNQMAAALTTAEQQRQQLLADIAHELRTPLSVMRGHIEAMLDGIFPLTPENLAVAHEETILLGRLIEDLRTLSLAEVGQFPLQKTAVFPSQLLNQTIAAFTPLAEADNIQLTAHIPANLPPIQADPNRLQQLLGNLLTNAFRHAATATPHVTLTARQTEANLQVSIADNGVGLSPEAQHHVFDRFWRADPARSRQQGGSGLGLAICRAIVEAHNGRIWVESTPGAGATFTFHLPLA